MRKKGLWIYNLSNCEGGSPSAIVNRAKAAGLGRVLIKIADGEDAFNETAPAIALVQGLHSAGIQAWSWAYSYGSSVETATAEANFAAHRALGLGVDGHVIDAEIEYEVDGSSDWATAHWKEFKRVASGMTLGLTSFWSPLLHPTFPWWGFFGVDIWNPQIYWADRDPAQTLSTSVSELSAYGAKPIIPISAATPDVDPTGTEGMAAFLKQAAGMDFPSGIDWYDWEDLPESSWVFIREAVL
jgi:hypothetical protein